MLFQVTYIYDTFCDLRINYVKASLSELRARIAVHVDIHECPLATISEKTNRVVVEMNMEFHLDFMQQ